MEPNEYVKLLKRDIDTAGEQQFSASSLTKHQVAITLIIDKLEHKSASSLYIRDSEKEVVDISQLTLQW
jgi:hypothetical protein